MQNLVYYALCLYIQLLFLSFAIKYLQCLTVQLMIVTQGLSFNKIPSIKNEIFQQNFLQNIHHDGTLPKDVILCSNHFEDYCFKRDLQLLYVVLLDPKAVVSD